MKKILIIIGTLFVIASLAFVVSSTSDLKGQFAVGAGPRMGQAMQQSITEKTPEIKETEAPKILEQNTLATTEIKTDVVEEKEQETPDFKDMGLVLDTKTENTETEQAEETKILTGAPEFKQDEITADETKSLFVKNSIHLVVINEAGERLMDLGKYDFNFDDNEIIEFTKGQSFYEFKLRNGTETHIMITAEGYENERTQKIDPSNSIDPVTIQLTEKVEEPEEEEIIIEEETEEESTSSESNNSSSSNTHSEQDESVTTYAAQYTGESSDLKASGNEITTEPEGCSHNFIDISGHSNEADICALVEMGIISDTNTLYEPDRPISVAEYMQILLKITGHSSSNANSALLGNPNHWANGWIAKAEELDVMRVRDGFSRNLDLPITKADAALYAVRLAQVQFYPERSPFQDVSRTDYFGYAVIYLAEQNVIQTNSDYFNPYNYLSRGKAMGILLNTFNTLFQ